MQAQEAARPEEAPPWQSPTEARRVSADLALPEADIYLVGYGIRLPNDLTLEALAILRSCNRVFGAPPISAPELGLPEMENLLLLYAPDRLRVDTYAEMGDLILKAAVDDPPVAFATVGSPIVGTTAAHRILEEGPRLGLTVYVSNAASSFEGIFADLNLEPFAGLTVWEATAFVSQKIVPDVRTHLVLPQAPIFDVSFGFDPKDGILPMSAAFVELRSHLLEFYPEDHVVHLVDTGENVGSYRPGVLSFPLKELEPPDVKFMGSTLVVPRPEK